MRADNLDTVRALLNQALYLLNAHVPDDGGGGAKENATGPGQAAVAQDNIGEEPAKNCSSNPEPVFILRKSPPRWSPAEDKLLLSGLSFGEVAEQTGRTVRAAKIRKQILLNPNSRRARDAHAKACQSKYQSATTPAPASRRRWTLEDVLLLNDHHLTDAEIALQLGRSYNAVFNQRRELRAKQARGAA